MLRMTRMKHTVQNLLAQMYLYSKFVVNACTYLWVFLMLLLHNLHFLNDQDKCVNTTILDLCVFMISMEAEQVGMN